MTVYPYINIDIYAILIDYLIFRKFNMLDKDIKTRFQQRLIIFYSIISFNK